MRTMVQAVPQVTRRPRSPQHPFHVRHAPYEIQPFFIAPVLPGETLENLSLQSRALTQPITNPLIGWWIEYYIFYVKHRDMEDSAYLQALMLDPAATLASAADFRTAATDLFYYFKGTAYDYVKACTRVVVKNFFRDEGRAWDSCTIDGNPAAYLEGRDFSDSLLTEADWDASDVTIPVDAGPAPDVVYASDVALAMETYRLLAMGGLVNATYEDWLRSYGVRSQSVVVNKPELVRYIREWSYPSSHVQPNAATPALSDVTSAVSWSIAERADKKRYFKEPGFLVGYTVARPKTYNSWQQRSAVSLLDNAYAWLPAILGDNADFSWKVVPDDANTGIFDANMTTAARLDVKDLFLYGEQFRNFANGTAGTNEIAGVADPSTNLREPVQAGVDALFASGDATSGVRQDGVVRLSIMGHQHDTSPRGSVTGQG